MADGDLVLTARRSQLGPGMIRLVGNIFRIEGDRIVEHWDVTQDA